jgi:hypothetical protein
VGRKESPEPAAAELSAAEVLAIRAQWCKGSQYLVQWSIFYKGPTPEAPKEEQRRTKAENAAVRAARLEGTLLESLAVALQGKRPPPTPSPASKATLAQEGPSKAAAISRRIPASQPESPGEMTDSNPRGSVGLRTAQGSRVALHGVRHCGAREKQPEPPRQIA